MGMWWSRATARVGQLLGLVLFATAREMGRYSKEPHGVGRSDWFRR